MTIKDFSEKWQDKITPENWNSIKFDVFKDFEETIADSTNVLIWMGERPPLK